MTSAGRSSRCRRRAAGLKDQDGLDAAAIMFHAASGSASLVPGLMIGTRGDQTLAVNAPKDRCGKRPRDAAQLGVRTSPLFLAFSTAVPADRATSQALAAHMGLPVCVLSWNQAEGPSVRASYDGAQRHPW